MVLVAQEDYANQIISSLSTQFLEQHPDIPVICVGLADNVVRVYTSSALPARSQDPPWKELANEPGITRPV